MIVAKNMRVTGLVPNNSYLYKSIIYVLSEKIMIIHTYEESEKRLSRDYETLV